MKKIILIGLFLITFAGSAWADVITNTDSVAMVNGEDATITLSKFESSLGTLTRIYIEFTTALNPNGLSRFDNDNSLQQTFTVTLYSDPTDYFNVDFSLAGTGISANGSDFYIAASSSAITLEPTDGDSTSRFNTGGDDYAEWNAGEQMATSGGYVNSTDFSDYIGTGNLTATINSLIEYTASGELDLVRQSHTTPTGTFSAKIIYEYAAVPEPAAIGLVSLGGIVTLVTNRLKRKK